MVSDKSVSDSDNHRHFTSSALGLGGTHFVKQLVDQCFFSSVRVCAASEAGVLQKMKIKAQVSKGNAIWWCSFILSFFFSVSSSS